MYVSQSVIAVRNNISVTQCYGKVIAKLNPTQHPIHPPNGAYMRQCIRLALVEMMACRLFGTKPLSKQVPGYCELDP